VEPTDHTSLDLAIAFFNSSLPSTICHGRKLGVSEELLLLCVGHLLERLHSGHLRRLPQACHGEKVAYS
jgi:hypothetical protein